MGKGYCFVIRRAYCFRLFHSNEAPEDPGLHCYEILFRLFLIENKIVLYESVNNYTNRFISGFIQALTAR